jgi:hypothetical protein
VIAVGELHAAASAPIKTANPNTHRDFMQAIVCPGSSANKPPHFSLLWSPLHVLRKRDRVRVGV